MSHARRAAAFTADRGRLAWHDRAVFEVRRKRDAAAAEVPEWAELRALAAAIKQHTLGRLADYVEQFEANATARGVRVHFARDAAEHNRVVASILRDRDVRRVVKSKSMLTEECGLNPYLEARGIEVIDTDLGERIVQLRREPPSHIVMPAIHLRREEVGELFARHLGTPPGDCDPEVLTEAARVDLRRRFLAAEAGITGVNFAVAESGGFVVVTNEGNADLGATLPPLHIACMGIEKIVPRVEDLGVFLRLLARSATGQSISAYTSHFHGPRDGSELHVVLVDNGRSRLLADERHARSLRCIRCGACLNTCPVYRRSGGHSYGTSVAGPIGAVLASAKDLDTHRSLPDACTLCRSCDAVCPVGVDLAAQLVALRSSRWRRGGRSLAERIGVAVGAAVLRHPRAFAFAGRLARACLRRLGGRVRSSWGHGRELPDMPRRSFREIYSDREGRR